MTPFIGFNEEPPARKLGHYKLRKPLDIPALSPEEEGMVKQMAEEHECRIFYGDGDTKGFTGLIIKAAVFVLLALPALAQSPSYYDGYRTGERTGTYDRWSATSAPDVNPWRHDPIDYPRTEWARGYTSGLNDAHDADVEHQRMMEWLSR